MMTMYVTYLFQARVPQLANVLQVLADHGTGRPCICEFAKEFVILSRLQCNNVKTILILEYNIPSRQLKIPSFHLVD
jgi:hypothetical protein